MRATPAEVQPSYANVLHIAVGPNVIRLSFGETVDNANRWHTSVYLPKDVAKQLALMIVNSEKKPPGETEQ